MRALLTLRGRVDHAIISVLVEVSTFQAGHNPSKDYKGNRDKNGSANECRYAEDRRGLSPKFRCGVDQKRTNDVVVGKRAVANDFERTFRRIPQTV